MTHLNQIYGDVKRFGTHSMRSGGATIAAENDISSEMIEIHGRWSTGSTSKVRYIKRSNQKRLKISQALGI